MSLCENICTYIGYDSTSKKALCECGIKYQEFLIEELNNQISNTKLNAVDGNIYVTKDSVLAGGTNAILLNGADLNLQNGEATPIDLSSLYLNEDTDIKIDVDIINNKVEDKYGWLDFI